MFYSFRSITLTHFSVSALVYHSVRKYCSFFICEFTNSPVDFVHRLNVENAANICFLSGKMFHSSFIVVQVGFKYRIFDIL